MTDQNNFHNNQTTFYNIDIYNDNSTGGDISSVFTTSFQSPLLLNPSHHEITVARARIPCDQIPLSQDNIPFHQWQIEIGVPVVGKIPVEYTYYNSYVPQFLPVPAYILYFHNATIGLNGSTLQTLQIMETTPPAGDVPLVLQPWLSPVTQTYLANSPNLSNVAYGKDYYYEVNSLTTLNVYQYLGTEAQELSIYSGGYLTNAQIYGICATQSQGTFYVLAYDLNYSTLVIVPFINIASEPTILVIASLPSSIDINSFSCNGTYLSVSVQNGNTCQIYNYSTDPMNFGTPVLLPNQPAPVTNFNIYTYVDANNIYYQAPIRINLGVRDPDFRSYDINNPQNGWLQVYQYNIMERTFTRFLGNDMDGKIMACYTNEPSSGGGHRIEAYNSNGGDRVYFITIGPEPYSLSTFYTVSFPVPEGPSLTPNYPIMTINEYLGQINLAFANIIAQIPPPLSSPLQTPTLVFDSTLSIINIITDKSCLSSLSTACVINFNKLLWSFFKFTSTPAVSQNLGIGARTLTISFEIQPQPNSTLYRFSDLTRIIIGTNRMGVKGDNESFNTMLVNIGDFTIDTSNGIPELVIYNPTVLRFYQLYQTTPLLNIDIFVSYANRAGKVFPITISPYNSIGLKLQFKNSNDPNKSYTDS